MDSSRPRNSIRAREAHSLKPSPSTRRKSGHPKPSPKPRRKRSAEYLAKLDARAAERFDDLLNSIGDVVAFVQVPRDALAKSDEPGASDAVTVLDVGLARLDGFRDEFDQTICQLWAGGRTAHMARKLRRESRGRRDKQ